MIAIKEKGKLSRFKCIISKFNYLSLKMTKLKEAVNLTPATLNKLTRYVTHKRVKTKSGTIALKEKTKI